MRFPRYRRPSVSTMLGVTKAKKRFNRATGLTAIKKPLRMSGNAKRTALRRVGYYSGPAKLTRVLSRIFR